MSMERDIVVIERKRLYDEISSVLTRYEEIASGDRDDISNKLDGIRSEMYELLVEIQNNWEAVITSSID